MDFPWLGIFFWLGVFSWFSVIVWTRYLRERERQQTLRAFAESGRTIDPETLQKLFPVTPLHAPPSPWTPSPGAAARGLAAAGTVVVFLGAGLLAGAQFVSRIEPEALWGMSTAGALISCIGVGLLAAAFVMRRMASLDLRSDQQPAQDTQNPKP